MRIVWSQLSWVDLGLLAQYKDLTPRLPGILQTCIILHVCETYNTIYPSVSTLDYLCVWIRSFFCPLTSDCKHSRDFWWEIDPNFLPFFSLPASFPFFGLQFKEKCEAQIIMTTVQLKFVFHVLALLCFCETSVAWRWEVVKNRLQSSGNMLRGETLCWEGLSAVCLQTLWDAWGLLKKQIEFQYLLKGNNVSQVEEVMQEVVGYYKIRTFLFIFFPNKQ